MINVSLVNNLCLNYVWKTRWDYIQTMISKVLKIFVPILTILFSSVGEGFEFAYRSILSFSFWPFSLTVTIVDCNWKWRILLKSSCFVSEKKKGKGGKSMIRVFFFFLTNQRPLVLFSLNSCTFHNFKSLLRYNTL